MDKVNKKKKKNRDIGPVTLQVTKQVQKYSFTCYKLSDQV